MLALLEEERSALSHADMARLTRIAPRKQAVLRRIEGQPTPIPEGLAQALRASARRNGALLAAAIKGVRDARLMVVSARSVARDDTYGPRGEKVALSAMPNQLEHKA